MWTRRRFLAATGALAGLSASAVMAAGPAPRILVAYHDQPDGLWRTAANGDAIGVAPEILEEIVVRGAGLPVDFLPLPWLRAQQAVESGDADALFTFPNEARRRYMLFTPSPLVSYEVALVYRSDGAATAALDRVETAADLARFLYVFNRFDAFQTARAQGFPSTMPAPGDPSMLREIAGGRGDFTILISLRVRPALDMLGLQDRLKLRPLPALGTVSHFFGLRRSHPDAADMIERIEAASRTAAAEGRIRAILARHA